MFYQVTDNIAADCAAYDSWCAANIALCEDCGADPENTPVAALFDVHGVNLCVDCLKNRYDDVLGVEMVSQMPHEFVRFMYPDSRHIDDSLADDVWDYILYPKLKSELSAKRVMPSRNYDTLYWVEVFCLEDESEWCEWLNKNT